MLKKAALRARDILLGQELREQSDQRSPRGFTHDASMFNVSTGVSQVLKEYAYVPHGRARQHLAIAREKAAFNTQYQLGFKPSCILLESFLPSRCCYRSLKGSVGGTKGSVRNWFIKQLGLDGYNEGAALFPCLPLPSNTISDLLFLPVGDNFGRYLGFLVCDHFLLVLVSFLSFLSPM